MTSLILIAVVGVLGSLVLCWIPRTAAICVYETGSSQPAVPSGRVVTDGWLAAMTARNHQGVLGGNRCAARCAHERLAKAVGYSGGRSKRGHS